MTARAPMDDSPEEYKSTPHRSDNYIRQSSYRSYEDSKSNPKPDSEVEKLNAVYNIQKQEESWIKSYWRPCMGWLYMVICAFDFIIFPLLTMFLPIIGKIMGINLQYTVWSSITLSNGGLIHLAFGAILGITAWSRGTEKVTAMNNYR